MTTFQVSEFEEMQAEVYGTPNRCRCGCPLAKGHSFCSSTCEVEDLLRLKPR